MKFNFFNSSQGMEKKGNKMESADKALDTGFSSDEKELKSRLEENKSFFSEKQ